MDGLGAASGQRGHKRVEMDSSSAKSLLPLDNRGNGNGGSRSGEYSMLYFDRLAWIDSFSCAILRYAGYGSFFLGIFLIYQTKPLEALDIKYWAKPRALAELEVEHKMLDKLSLRPDLQARLAAVGKVLNLIEDESYDLILMRNEYKVQMGLDSGKVPSELKEIYDELSS